MFPAYQCN